MRRVIRAARLSLDGADLRVYYDNGQGLYLEIIEAAKEQLDAMLSHHARVLVIRLDIRQHDYTADNKPMSRFMAKLVKRLKRRYQFQRVGFIWVREVGEGKEKEKEEEKEEEKQQHYHLALMLDGRTVRHPARVIELAEEIAEGWDWPKPYTCENCYYLIHRKDAGQYQEALYRISYMAKVRTKGLKAIPANNSGRSAVKPRREAPGVAA